MKARWLVAAGVRDSAQIPRAAPLLDLGIRRELLLVEAAKVAEQVARVVDEGVAAQVAGALSTRAADCSSRVLR